MGFLHAMDVDILKDDTDDCPVVDALDVEPTPVGSSEGMREAQSYAETFGLVFSMLALDEYMSPLYAF